MNLITADSYFNSATHMLNLLEEKLGYPDLRFDERWIVHSFYCYNNFFISRHHWYNIYLRYVSISVHIYVFCEGISRCSIRFLKVFRLLIEMCNLLIWLTPTKLVTSLFSFICFVVSWTSAGLVCRRPEVSSYRGLDVWKQQKVFTKKQLILVVKQWSMRLKYTSFPVPVGSHWALKLKKYIGNFSLCIC